MGLDRREWFLVGGVCAVLALLVLGPNVLEWLGLAQPRNAAGDEPGFPFEYLLVVVLGICLMVAVFQQAFRD